MTRFYVSEAGCPWEPTNAKTLASAKRAARLKQSYQGTQLQVGVKLDNDTYMTKARLIVDALNFSDRGYWHDL